ncbi:hypothetical protein Tco_0134555 [Tanacetum coccineum]
MTCGTSRCDHVQNLVEFKVINNMLLEWDRFVTVMLGIKELLQDMLLKNLVPLVKELSTVSYSQARQIKCYNCNDIGYIARNYTQPKRPQNSEYFKDKMLLMQAQENRVALDEEQLLFIAGGQDNVVDEDVDEQPVYDLALNVDNMFQADDCDAFDSDVDEFTTVQTMFMANLSSADPIYDESSLSYDSDILSERCDLDLKPLSFDFEFLRPLILHHLLDLNHLDQLVLLTIMLILVTFLFDIYVHSSDPGPQCSTTVLEQDSLSPSPQSPEHVPQVAITVTTSNELELLYSPMFSELLNGTSHVVSKSSAIHSIEHSFSSTHQTQLKYHLSLHLRTLIKQKPYRKSQFDDMNYQHLQYTGRTKGNNGRHLRTRRQLETEGEMKELHHLSIGSRGISADRHLQNMSLTKVSGKTNVMRKILSFRNNLVLWLREMLKGKEIDFQRVICTKFSPLESTIDHNCGIQIHQSPRGIFINQAKYAQEILKKHGMTSCDSIGTPMATKHLDADLSDSDHAGCLDSRKSTSGGIQFIGGDKLVSWSSKKQDYTSMSSAEAEYVSLSACCAQVLWLRTQLTDYGFHFDKIPMYCDSKAAIAISCNPVQHSRTKHIDVRYHFIKEQVEKGIVELFFVGTEYQLADLFTKALSEDRFKYLVRRLGMRCLTPDELEVLENESA